MVIRVQHKKEETMKKTYIAPQAEVIKVACATFLAASARGLDGFGGYGGEDYDGKYEPD
jgi:hypothetical protein